VAARIQIPSEARRGDVIEVRILIQHPMETGYRHDDVGHLIKRNVINALSCRYGGVEVFRASMGAGIAANPYLKFFVRAEQTGDIECRWVDQENASGYASARVTVNG